MNQLDRFPSYIRRAWPISRPPTAGSLYLTVRTRPSWCVCLVIPLPCPAPHLHTHGRSAPSHTQRWGHSSAVLQGNVIVFGGYDSRYFNDVNVFVPGAWHSIALPSAAALPSVTSVAPDCFTFVMTCRLCVRCGGWWINPMRTYCLGYSHRSCTHTASSSRSLHASAYTRNNILRGLSVRCRSANR